MLRARRAQTLCFQRRQQSQHQRSAVMKRILALPLVLLLTLITQRLIAVLRFKQRQQMLLLAFTRCLMGHLRLQVGRLLMLPILQMPVRFLSLQTLLQTFSWCQVSMAPALICLCRSIRAVVSQLNLARLKARLRLVFKARQLALLFSPIRMQAHMQQQFNPQAAQQLRGR